MQICFSETLMAQKLRTRFDINRSHVHTMCSIFFVDILQQWQILSTTIYYSTGRTFIFNSRVRALSIPFSDETQKTNEKRMMFIGFSEFLMIISLNVMHILMACKSDDATLHHEYFKQYVHRRRKICLRLLLKIYCAVCTVHTTGFAHICVVHIS